MNEFVIAFFKRMKLYNKEYFDKIRNNTIVVDKKYKDIKEFVGFYPDNFKLILPKINTYQDILIWIHEYSHALFPDDEDEIFPNLMEAYFINIYIKDKYEINKLIASTIEEINNSSDKNHTIAKKLKLNTITKN